jgi:hypothetical protein
VHSFELFVSLREPRQICTSEGESGFAPMTSVAESQPKAVNMVD